MTESSLYDGCVSTLSFLVGRRWGMGSATPFSYLGREPFGRAGQALPELHLRLPTEARLGEGDVGAALRRVVLRQRLVHDLRRAGRDLQDELGQLLDGELVGVADVDRADEVGVEQGEEAAN